MRCGLALAQHGRGVRLQPGYGLGNLVGTLFSKNVAAARWH
ncbi:hypothetical protein AB0952_21010 [Streptomyces caniferus]